MGLPLLELTGQKFNSLTVLRLHNIQNGRTYWQCRCDCGKRVVVIGYRLKNGHNQSCGCAKWDGRNRTHGESHNKKTPEYIVWKSMRNRCNNPNNQEYYLYGGRGVTVCERWNSYENFLADMGRRPSRLYSIDRYPDPYGGYEPANCRWATRQEQALNRRPEVAGNGGKKNKGKKRTAAQRRALSLAHMR